MFSQIVVAYKAKENGLNYAASEGWTVLTLISQSPIFTELLFLKKTAADNYINQSRPDCIFMISVSHLNPAYMLSLIYMHLFFKQQCGAGVLACHVAHFVAFNEKEVRAMLPQERQRSGWLCNKAIIWRIKAHYEMGLLISNVHRLSLWECSTWNSVLSKTSLHGHFSVQQSCHSDGCFISYGTVCSLNLCSSAQLWASSVVSPFSSITVG